MKIAVVGIGVAGAYLLNRLSKEHEVIGFERMREEEHDSICAWATTIAGMRGLIDKTGLNFDDYILHKGVKMDIVANNSFSLRLKGLCTYDKIGLIKDLIKGCKINYGIMPSNDIKDEFDLVIDATGFNRTFLPKPKNELWIPTIQYKVKYDKMPFDDFMLKPFPSMSGYFWYFPLNDNYAHIGAGDKNRKHKEIVDQFIAKYGGRIVKKVGRPVRLTPPALCEPFIDDNVVGVGESIGTVYALLGEGIIPSTTCADLLINNIDNLERYRYLVHEKFRIYYDVFRFVKSKITNEFSLIKYLPILLKIYLYMKKNEDRFGMEINISKLFSISRL
ncbi:MAG: dehydrogenase [Candidatus Nitrosocaldaceae archaeon]|nr:MAG: dehydrogenase [Candidatus Nitrosocaldaceae archaeon]